jgi:hypothetical protein
MIGGLLASVVLGLFVGVAASAAPNTLPPAPIDLATRTGAGEALLLVVTGEYPAETEAREAADQLSFGDMQGFYVDASANYDVLGVYDQTSPDYELTNCQAAPQQVAGCNGPSALVALPVSLAYLPLDRAREYLQVEGSQACGQTGQAPCMAARLGRLLSEPDRQFRSGTYLVLTAFRTKKGAEEFVELARNRGFEVAVIRAQKLGGPYIGLGQEANPDGVSGPLIDPLPNQDEFQR